jgi:hypothetical protein
VEVTASQSLTDRRVTRGILAMDRMASTQPMCRLLLLELPPALP